MTKIEPSKTGWLSKLGGRIKSKKNRFFALFGNELRYYKKEKDYREHPGNPISFVSIESPQRVKRTTDIRKLPAFNIFDAQKNRQFEIIALNEKEADEWVEAIKKACSEAMRAAVKVSPTDFKIVQSQFSKSKIKNSYVELVELSHNNNDGNIIQTRYVQKIYEKGQIAEQAKIEEMSRTYQSLCTQSNPFVTALEHIFEDGDTIIFIEEYVPHGCLFGYLWRNGRFNERRARLYAAEILLALSFLHDNGIFFGDLDPRPILLCDDGHIKLTVPGFTVLKPYQENRLNVYSPPEYFVSASTNNARSDWYAFGVILYEMICGLPPFWDSDPQRLQDAIVKEQIRFPRHVSDSAKDLIRLLMNRVPDSRIGAGPKGVEEIKNHPFFYEIIWESLLEKKAMKPEFIPKDSDPIFVSVDY